MRESPALRVISLLRDEGAVVEYHDPHVAELPKLGLRNHELDAALLHQQDVVVVVTDHRAIDWDLIARESPMVVDLRNVVPDTGGAVWRL
jgi:UDP-N-acetyl-D-glucosamine dehydrogenase